MSQSTDDHISSLLARARHGFLKLEELLDPEALRASRRAKEELEALLEAVEEMESPRILVVDDEQMVRDVIVHQLEARGFVCRTAESPEEAWESLEDGPPQAIVSDVIMPGTSGIEFLSQVMQRFPDIVMVMISAAPDVSMTIEALRMGAVDFLLKPLDYDKLDKTLRTGLDRRRAHIEQLRYQLNLEVIVNERTHRLLEYSNELEKRTRQLGRAYHDLVVRLGRASQWRDDETGAHVERIGIFSAEIARALDLPRKDVELLAEAAPLHDIGKIGVPDSILLKPGRLTAEEYDLMKRHTTIGAMILSGSDVPLLRASEEIALTHHEWYDGTGYPTGLHSDQIPIFGAIVAVADVYDALIHDRVYKVAFPREETLALMRELRGTQFSPRVLDAFFSVEHKFVELEKAVAAETQPLRQGWQLKYARKQ